MQILKEVPKPPSNIPTEQELMASWQGNLDEPLLTIKCITYNHVSFIRDALHGFLIQRTDFPFRIVVHDDASTDGTQEIIKQYSEKYPHVIRAVLQETNLFSRGLKRGPYVHPLVAGEYIAPCEGDDYWIDRHKLQRQVNFLSANPLYAASTENAIIFFTEDGRFEAFSKQPEHDIDVIELLGPRPFTTASVVYRAAAIAGRSDALKIAGDIGTWCYLATKGNIKYTPIYSSVYRRGQHGLVLGSDRFQWARKMEQWNQDIARFLENDELDPVFRKRIFNNYKSALYSKSVVPFHRVKALESAFRHSPRRTIKLVAKAALPQALGRNAMNKKIQRWRDFKTDQKRLESASVSLRADGPRKVADNLIVSLTTSPPRIRQAWMAIESILRQDVAPERIVLVLEDDAFPRRILPKSVKRQMGQGLEIVWAKAHINRLGVALSAARLFPGYDVMTADDGILYPEGTIRNLVEARKMRSEEIIGCTGWEIGSFDNALLPSRLWTRASSNSLGPQLLLTGRTAVLFPASFFRSRILSNQALAMQLCPDAEDLWFWAAAAQEGMGFYCLGIPYLYEMKCQRESRVEAVGSDQFDHQLLRLIEYFSRSESPLT